MNFVNFTSGPHFPPPSWFLREIVNFVNFTVLARRRTFLFFNLLVGGGVLVELTAYDSTKGRITCRFR